MSEVILPGALHRETEFVGGLTGACGPNALAMGACWAFQRSRPDTYGIYLLMQAKGLCAASGASTLDALNQEAQNIGMNLTAYRGYGEPWPADGVSGWRAFYLLHAGHSFILMETAYGQALTDAISGLGENARDLHYHFIGVVGHHDGGFSPRSGRTLPAGWWCCDGDNYVQGDSLQFYPDDVMALAQPCGAIAFGAKVSIAMAGVPGGWHDANGVLTAPNGKSVGHGFSQHILDAAAWPAALQPLGGEYGNPARQDFALSLSWGGAGASEMQGPDFPAQVAALQAQVAALQNQPHTNNPLADDALATMQSLKELLAKV